MFKPKAINRKKVGRFCFAHYGKEGVTLANEKLEKLEHEKYVSEQKLRAAKNKEKYLMNQIKQLTRSERTHRLCTRAGMLESFLREPTLLTDDDVMELLTFLFHGEAAQKKLANLIENRRKTIETETF